MGKLAAAAGAACLFLVLLLVAIFIAVAGTQDQSTGIAGAICAPQGSTGAAPAQLDADQMRNAAAIIAAGAAMKVPPKADVVAIATAMQESNLKNLSGGDRDSAGLFQQRPSQGWGTLQQVTDPAYSAKTFFGRLLAIPNWDGLPVSQAAQAVQRSAFPSAYAKWEQLANTVVGAVGGVTCGTPQAPGSAASGGNRSVIQAALSQVGVPYVWGGGGAQGPTGGGFDCSGLAQFAWAKAGIAVPHQTQAIWSAFQPPIRDHSALQPGDLILLSDNGSPSGIHHVGIYLGNDQLVEAPRTGLNVRVVSNIWNGPDTRWTREFIGAVRPGSAPAQASTASKA